MRRMFFSLLLSLWISIHGIAAAIELPAPAGPNKIGTRVFHITDPHRKNSAEDPSDFRELIIQLLYPADPPAGKSSAPYLMESNLVSALKQEKYLDLSPEILDSWRSVRTHAVQNAPLIESPKQLPLILFSPGFGMSRANYTAICEDLASHGYIVALIDHPYSGLMITSNDRVFSFRPDPGGPEKRVGTMAEDLQFVLKTLLDESAQAGVFASMVDPSRVAALGHSIGGATALEVCRIDNAFAACADLDGDPFGKVETEGVKRPFLVVLNEPAEGHRPPVAMREQRDQQWQKVVSQQKTPAFLIKVNGTNHFSFSDIPFLVPDALMKKNGASLTPARTFEITSVVLRAFFAQRLDQANATTLAAISKDFSEITLQSFHVEAP